MQLWVGSTRKHLKTRWKYWCYEPLYHELYNTIVTNTNLCNPLTISSKSLFLKRNLKLPDFLKYIHFTKQLHTTHTSSSVPHKLYERKNTVHTQHTHTKQKCIQECIPMCIQKCAVGIVRCVLNASFRYVRFRLLGFEVNFSKTIGQNILK